MNVLEIPGEKFVLSDVAAQLLSEADGELYVIGRDDEGNIVINRLMLNGKAMRVGLGIDSGPAKLVDI